MRFEYLIFSTNNFSRFPYNHLVFFQISDTFYPILFSFHSNIRNPNDGIVNVCPIYFPFDHFTKWDFKYSISTWLLELYFSLLLSTSKVSHLSTAHSSLSVFKLIHLTSISLERDPLVRCSSTSSSFYYSFTHSLEKRSSLEQIIPVLFFQQQNVETDIFHWNFPTLLYPPWQSVTVLPPAHNAFCAPNLNRATPPSQLLIIQSHNVVILFNTTATTTLELKLHSSFHRCHHQLEYQQQQRLNTPYTAFRIA